MRDAFKGRDWPIEHHRNTVATFPSTFGLDCVDIDVMYRSVVYVLSATVRLGCGPVNEDNTIRVLFDVPRLSQVREARLTGFPLN